MLEAATGRALFDQGRTAEAGATLSRLEAERGDMLPRTEIVTAGLRARLASAAGSHDRAATAARRAADLSSATDDPYLAGAALFDLAVVMKAGGRAAEAAAAAAAALERFEAKGASLPASRVRDWLAPAAGEPGGSARA